MKIVSWNIRHGGTKIKLPAICDQMTAWSPDIVGLTEYRNNETSKAIANRLDELGLVHQVTTRDACPTAKNFLMLASRFPIEHQPATGLLEELGRWLHVKVECIEIMLMHVPNRSANKWQFHEEAIAQFEKYQSVPAIAMGDTNTGRSEIDEENKFFNKRENKWFDRINSAGWVDVWRNQNPDKREFTYYHHGRTGFRLDQVFAPDQFAVQLTNVRYDWGGGGREAKLSDHAAVVFEVPAKLQSDSN